MTSTLAEPHRPIRSFSYRSRNLSNIRKQAFDRLWERYGRTVSPQSFRPEKLFDQPEPITLEIGFGRGEALLDEARTCPRSNVLGIEVYRPALFSVLRQAEQFGIENIRLIAGDAAVLLPQFPDDSLQQIRILFPDPWPKRRHQKRRLLQDPFVAECARCLTPGGALHLATDWANYAQQIELILTNAACWRRIPNPPNRPRTYFEKRGQNQGHDIREWLLELQPPTNNPS